MAGSGHDTDSQISEDGLSEARESTSGAEEPVGTARLTECHRMADKPCPEAAAASAATGAAAAYTLEGGGAAAQLQAKLQEVVSMAEAATAGVDATQSAHDMMGQLWSICASQQAQLGARDQVCTLAHAALWCAVCRSPRQLSGPRMHPQLGVFWDPIHLSCSEKRADGE